MSNVKKLMMTAAAGGGPLNVENVFSTYLYEGTGSTQSITNGIDLSGEGGLVWIKHRDSATQHRLFDTERGANVSLTTNDTSANDTLSGALTSFNSDGFTLGSHGNVNANNYDLTSWTFRKAPKFFDVVTYTGDGNSGRTISHNLESTPGIILIKRTNSSRNWILHHRVMGFGQYSVFNTGSAFTASSNHITASSSTTVTVGSNTDVNANGSTYVMYVFAHNNNDGGFGTNEDQDIIKCGAYYGNSSTNGTEVDLGFEPQWVMIKNADQGSRHYAIFDNMRGVTFDNIGDIYSEAGSSNADANPVEHIEFNSTGFKLRTTANARNQSGYQYVYMAIRRGPMGLPESGDDVFQTAFRDGTEPGFDSGWPVDMAIYYNNIDTTHSKYIGSRLQGYWIMQTASIAAEQDLSAFLWDYMDGYYENTGVSTNVLSHMWRRYPQCFDVVPYTGTGSASLTVDHNLGVVPEMMWVKRKSGTSNWKVYHKDLTNLNSYCYLNTSAAEVTNQTNVWPTAPTATQLTIGNYTGDYVGGGDTGIAYLFATLDGVTKVGSYTGNGTSNGDSQNIDCGFSNGAKFVLIKDIDASSNWFVVDTERGLVAGADKHVSLNTVSAQETDDVIDPYSAGFTVVRFAGEFNQSGRTYIFYAVAA